MVTGNTVITTTSVPEAGLLTPTAAQGGWALGQEIVVENTANLSETTFTYVKAQGMALTQYQPYILDLGAAAGREVVVSAPVTLGAPGAKIAIPQVAFTSGYYGFVATKGYCKALHAAETYAAGDMLQLLSGGTVLVVDGSTGSTIKSVNTCGVTITAGTTAVAKDVYLNGEQAVVAAT